VERHEHCGTITATSIMNAPEDSGLEGCTTFLTLDDACLAAILGGLSPRQLRTAAAVCKRLAAISRADSLWTKHIRDDFGLCVSTVKGVQQEPGAALKLYSRCAQQQLHQYTSSMLRSAQFKGSTSRNLCC
jgi:hypothetical protein